MSEDSVLIIDAANVVGSRPDGWWRDRPGAARRLYEQVTATELPYGQVVLVLEGAAKAGVESAAVPEPGLPIVVHAPRSGDDEIVDQARRHAGDGSAVTVVTADRGLESRLREVGAAVISPGGFLRDLS